MNIFAVYTATSIGGELEGIHTREWAADWHSWKEAEKSIIDPFWLGDPIWGYPGWANDTDNEAETWVATWNVTVP